jgi:hypothetical protein
LPPNALLQLALLGTETLHVSRPVADLFKSPVDALATITIAWTLTKLGLLLLRLLGEEVVVDAIVVQEALLSLLKLDVVVRAVKAASVPVAIVRTPLRKLIWTRTLTAT